MRTREAEGVLVQCSAVLGPLFEGTCRSMICGSSALAWHLAQYGVGIPTGDIDAVSLDDQEFAMLLDRLRNLARAGCFEFDARCQDAVGRFAGEEARFSAGVFLLADPARRIAFELFDRGSLYLGSTVNGSVRAGAGIVRVEAVPGRYLPVADVRTLQRINRTVFAEHERALRNSGGQDAPAFSKGGDSPSIVRDLAKRREWAALLDFLERKESAPNAERISIDATSF